MVFRLATRVIFHFILILAISSVTSTLDYCLSQLDDFNDANFITNTIITSTVLSSIVYVPCL